MDREMQEQLKQISNEKKKIRRCTEKEERLISEEEQELIIQLDSQRDELLGEMYSNTY